MQKIACGASAASPDPAFETVDAGSQPNCSTSGRCPACRKRQVQAAPRHRIATQLSRSLPRGRAASAFLKEFQYSLLVAAFHQEVLGNFTFVNKCPPEIVPLAVNPYEDRVQMPLPVVRPQPRNPTFTDSRSKHRPKPVPPEPHHFVADIDLGRMQAILHIARRRREPNILHYSELDDLRRHFETTEWVDFFHSGKRCHVHASLKISSSDTLASGDEPIFMRMAGLLQSARQQRP